MKICVFCSSSSALDTIYFNSAIQLGKAMSQNDMDLVFGAGGIGLMGTISLEMSQYGREIVGVIPEKLNKEHIVSKNVTQLFVTKDMSERKNIMIKQSDGFIALPGGFGTLEEILEVITLKQLGYFDKPIVFININNFYDNLFEMFEKIYTENFAKPDYRKLYYVTDSIQTAIDYIKNYKSENNIEKWY